MTQKSTVKQGEIQEFTCYQLNIKLKTLISKLESAKIGSCRIFQKNVLKNRNRFFRL